MPSEERSYIPNVLLNSLNSILFNKLPRPVWKSRQKILVYQVGNIGDLIVSTPVYRALREKFPDAEITLLSSSGSKKYVGADEIIKPLGYIDKIQPFFPEEFVSLKNYLSFYQSIRKEKYDLIVYLPSNLWKMFHILRDMTFFFLAGIRHGVGFNVFDGYHYYLKEGRPAVNEVERLFDLVKPLGIGEGNKKTEFAVSKGNTEFIKNLLSQQKIDEKKMKVAVMPGGKYPARLWPGKYFSALIDKINEDFSVNVILLGSENETDITTEIKNRTKKKPFDTSGSLTINQLGALIKGCDLLITNDSGPMHIAAAVETPTVSIFSAVDIPYLWYPSGDNHKVFYNKVDCSPCFQKTCDNHICMEGISVESVYEAVKIQLQKAGCDIRSST